MFSSSAKTSVTSTVLIALALMSGACAALRPTDANGPRADVQLYPVGLIDPGARLEEASLAWYQLSQQHGLQRRTQVNLDPYTGTLKSVPPELATEIELPKVGDAPQTEEQTRESLRRFIADWQRLIGAAPQELSLVERTDEARDQTRALRTTTFSLSAARWLRQPDYPLPQRRQARRAFE